MLTIALDFVITTIYKVRHTSVSLSLPMSFSRHLLVSVFGLLALLLPGWAQEPRDERSTPPPSAPASSESAATSPGAPADAVPGVGVERQIYLPYEDLEAVFEKDGRGVVVPYREFLQLWNELNAKRAEEAEEEPPLGGVVKSAVYTAELKGQGDAASLVIQGKIEVESFRKGWATIALGRGPLNIVEANTGETSLSLGDQGYELLVPHKGIYTVELTLLAPVRQQEAGFVAKPSLPRSPLSRLVVVIPGKDWRFQLDGNLPFTTGPDGKDSRIEFAFGEMQEVTLHWSRESADNRFTPLLFADSNLRSRVVTGAIQTTADLRYRILRAGVDHFEIEVPASHEVLLVEGNNLKEWSLAGSGKTQRIAVRLHAEVRDSYELHIVLEKSLGGLPAEIDVPTVTLLDVARQSGVLELSADSDLEARVKEVDGLSRQALPERTDESEFAARYRFLKAPYAATLQIDRAKPEVHAEIITAVHVRPEALEWQAAVTVDVSRAPVFETEIVLPAGFPDCRVLGDDVEDFKVSGEKVSIRLARQTGRSSFRIDASRKRVAEEEPLTTPLLHVTGATSQVARLVLEIDPGLDPLTEQSGDLLVVDPGILEEELASAGLSCHPGIGFRYAAGAKPGRLTLKARKPQVSATVSQLVRVEEETTMHRWWIDYDILFAGTSRLILRVPSVIAAQLQVGGAGPHEVNRNYRHLVEGKPVDAGQDVFWAVSFPERQQGKYRLELALDQAHAPIGFEHAEPIPVPVIGLVDVFRETGQLAIATAANLNVGTIEAEGWEAIDSRELHQPLGGEGLTGAFRYRTRPGNLTFPVTKNRYLEIPRALITHADVNAVLSGDGALTTEAIYWLRNAAESSLKVRLPNGARMVSDILVKDAAQQPVSQAGSNGQEVVIRLPPSSETKDTPFPVRFVYELASPDAGQSLPPRGEVLIPAPEVRGLQVLQTRNHLYLPPEYRYLGFAGPYELAGKVPGWREARKRLDFLIPALGAVNPEGINVPRTDPPAFDPGASTGLNAPVIKQGQSFEMHRLGAPAPVTVSFLSQVLSTALEAVLCLIALAVGMSMSRTSMESRFLFLIFAGLLPLALAGMVAPQMADLYRAVFLGAMASVGGWVIAGIWWLILPRAVPAPAEVATAQLPALGFREEEEEDDQDEEEPEPESEPEPQQQRPSEPENPKAKDESKAPE